MSFVIRLIKSNYDVIIVAVVLLLLFKYVVWYFKKYWRCPPGPKGLPFVGYIPFLPEFKEKTHYQHFDELRKKYGDVFMVRLGSYDVLVVNGVDNIHEAFNLASFSGRPMVYSFKMSYDAGETNLIFAEGEKWRFNKKISNKALGLLGSSKSSEFENVIHSCVDWFNEKVSKQLANPIVTRPLLMQCTGAMITSITFGQQSDPDSPFLKKLFDYASVYENPTEANFYIEFIPWLEYLYPRQSRLVRQSIGAVIAHIRNRMSEYVPNTQKVRNIADALERAAMETSMKEKQALRIRDDDIRDLAVDLFDAGFFTSAESIEWFLLILSFYPSEQETLFAEIDNVVGRLRYPSFQEDGDKMPYTKACVTEGLRYASSTAVPLYHKATEDTIFQGYNIPEGSIIMANIYGANHNPKAFPEPWRFNPNRFLRLDGTFNSEMAERVISFSLGKRRCPGEAFAKVELFVLLSSIIQKYRVELDPKVEINPLLHVNVGNFTIGAGDHSLIFKRRF